MNSDVKVVSGASEEFYSVFRHGILGGVNLVPVVGGFLSYLGGLFIPNAGESPEQMWRRLIGSSISDALLRKVQRDLIGLTDVARLYKGAIESGNNETILAQSIAANTQFTAMVPGFQISGEESTLLPLFAIAATLHLSLLRDMVLKGKDIGISDAHVVTLAGEMLERIKRYSLYVDTHVAAAIDKARRENSNGVGLKRNMPLSAMLATKTYYQITTKDLRDTWAGFDPVKFPGPSLITLNREVYTPICGWWDSRSRAPDVIPVWEYPKSPLASLKMWERSQHRTRFIFGFESKYTDGSILRSGSENGIIHAFPVERHIEKVVTFYTAGVFYMNFFSNGKWQGVGRTPEGETYEAEVVSAFKGHRLSSIRSVGEGREAAVGAVSGCVLGFQLIDQGSTPITKEVFDMISPKIAPQLHSWLSP